VQGRYSLAETVLKEALALNARLGDHHPSLADAILNVAVLYRVEGKADRAEPLLRKAAKIYSDAGDPHLAGALSEMGLIALRRGKYATAETNLNQALDILTKAFGPEHVSVGLVEATLAEVYLNERDYTKAELLIRGALEKERSSLGDASFEVAESFLIAAQIEEKQNRKSEADSDYRRAVALYGNVVGDDHPEALYARELYSRFAKTAHGQVRDLSSSHLKPGLRTLH
jgi:tetratricopeptide (TPR) repeat protein